VAGLCEQYQKPEHIYIHQRFLERKKKLKEHSKKCWVVLNMDKLKHWVKKINTKKK